MKHKTLQESLFLLLLILVILRILYGFRYIPEIGHYLSTYAAVLLIYVPVIHLTLRREFRGESLLFFEKKFPELVRSLRLFSLSVLILFPPFLIGNHFYQKIFFHRTFHFSGFEESIPLILTQLFLVALPEEFFFRGYLQGFMAQRFPKPLSLIKGLSLSQGALITSLLFAFSHSLISLQWWHFAIFFPSLVFAWLREKRGAITASILFHATSNLLVAWIGKCYL